MTVLAGQQNDHARDVGPGDQVGPYRIEDRLGSGGMGDVFRAARPDGAIVALKLVRRDMVSDDQLRRRFKREAESAARVKNKHVVPVLDFGEFQGLPYLAQEMINGGSLSERIDREGHLELERTVRLGLQVAKGLDAMHKAGIVHRDLKPGNILLDLDGCAYVADFGLVKDKDASILTRPGQALGTVDYMSPEQIRGTEINPAADIYSLGCVLFECISGAPPFAEKEGMRVMWAHLQEKPPDPCVGRAELPESLGWAVCQALEKEPEDRPPTATAYARMVQVAAGVPPMSPEGPS